MAVSVGVASGTTVGVGFDVQLACSEVGIRSILPYPDYQSVHCFAGCRMGEDKLFLELLGLLQLKIALTVSLNATLSHAFQRHNGFELSGLGFERRLLGALAYSTRR